MSFDSIIMENHDTCLNGDCPGIWVFGYGSLLWKPDFEYNSYQIGYIENYVRKFNQGNVTFRGTKDKPGRVANLEKKEGGKVWGVAFEVVGRDRVLKLLRALYEREIACGGYDIMTATLFPRNHKSLTFSEKQSPCLSSEFELNPWVGTSVPEGRKFSPRELDLSKEHKPDADSTTEVLVFTATPDSDQYLGPDSATNMVNQILEARGYAGTCIEYVLRTSEFIRKWIPEDKDRYLFDLDSQIRAENSRRQRSQSLVPAPQTKGSHARH